MPIRIDEDKLTVGDLEDFEEVTGTDLGDFMAAAQAASGDGEGKFKVSAKQLRALVWIFKRKEDPSFTFEAARDVEMGELELGPTGAPPRPTKAAAKSGGSNAVRRSGRSATSTGGRPRKSAG